MILYNKLKHNALVLCELNGREKEEASYVPKIKTHHILHIGSIGQPFRWQRVHLRMRHPHPAGSSGDASGAVEEVTLTFLNVFPMDETNPHFEKYIAQFEADHPG